MRKARQLRNRLAKKISKETLKATTPKASKGKKDPDEDSSKEKENSEDGQDSEGSGIDEL